MATPVADGDKFPLETEVSQEEDQLLLSESEGMEVEGHRTDLAVVEKPQGRVDQLTDEASGTEPVTGGDADGKHGIPLAPTVNVKAEEPIDDPPSDGSIVKYKPDGKQKKKRKKKKDSKKIVKSPAPSPVSSPPPKEGASGSDTKSSAAEEAGWSLVESRDARRRRARTAQHRFEAEREGRVNRTTDDLKGDKGRHGLPPPSDADGSDDEDWLETDGHPIDWYVEHVRSLVATGSSRLGKKARTKLRYAWKNYVPGDPCVYSRCIPHPKSERAARLWTSIPRYARHLVEKHVDVRPYLYCLKASRADTCEEYTDGDLFRCQRRVEMVRHLMDNKKCHHRPMLASVEKVNQCWANTTPVGRLVFRWVPNHLRRWSELTSHDWKRCCGDDSTPQTDLGPDDELPMPTPKNPRAPKRSRTSVKGTTKAPRDASKDEPPTKRPAEAAVFDPTRTAVGTDGTVVVSSVNLPPIASTLPERERVELGSTLTLVSNALGRAAALSCADVYVKQKVWSKERAAQKTAQKGATSTVTSDSKYVAGQDSGASPIPDTPSTASNADTPVVDSMSQAPTPGTSKEATAQQMLSEDIPDPGPDFATLQARGLQGLRDGLIRGASSLLRFQVDQIERAFVHGNQLLKAEAVRYGTEWMSERTRDLERRESNLERDIEYHRATARQAQARLDECDEKFFHEFGLKLTDWERLGFPSMRAALGLPPLATPAQFAQVPAASPLLHSAPPPEDAATQGGVGSVQSQIDGLTLTDTSGRLQTRVVTLSTSDSSPDPVGEDTEHPAMDQ